MEQPSGIKNFLIQIWPSVYRAINVTIFFLLSLFKDGVRRAIEQVLPKGGV